MSEDQHHNLQRKVLHSKRSFASRHKSADSQLYDASEEDNTDDASSAISVPIGHNTPHGSGRQLPTSPLAQGKSSAPGGGSTGRAASSSVSGGPGTSSHRAAGAIGRDNRLELESDDGVDSPTYDGDIESSTKAVPANHPGSSARYPGSPSTLGPNSPLLSTSSFTSAYPPSISESSASTNEALSPPPTTTAGFSTLLVKATPRATESNLPFFENEGMQLAENDNHQRPAPGEGVEVHTDKMSAEEIQAFVMAAIEKTDGTPRKYKINPPPKGRPIRIYADGVYDLFHFGHALQLRQAKLAFSSVYTLVGVNSDELCEQHKSRTVMSHAERCESVRHCKWVDQVVPEAPWVIDEEFLKKYEIDYVAHDEDPYKGSDGSDDVYGLSKELGKFLPTRRTPGVSTSDLIERFVRGYRNRDWDKKLDKIGHPELRAEGSEYDGSRPASPSKRSQPDDQHPESLRMTKVE